MALDPTRMGDAMATAVDAVGIVAGTPVTDAQRKAIWEGVATAIIAEFTANAMVNPGSFTTPTGGPVTGEGTIS